MLKGLFVSESYLKISCLYDIRLLSIQFHIGPENQPRTNEGQCIEIYYDLMVLTKETIPLHSLEKTTRQNKMKVK